MRGRIGVLMTVSGTMLLVLSMVLSTVAFAANRGGLPLSPGADVKYVPLQQGPCSSNSECNDNDPCTSDVCTDGECDYIAMGYPCCVQDMDCYDGDSCTADGCDFDTNTCERASVDPCVTCDDDLDCDDGVCDGYDSCYVEYGATSGRCEELFPPCGSVWDEYSCTDDVCIDEGGGGASCPSTPNDLNCADGNACTEDECNPYSPEADPVTGCVYEEITCDDFNDCTTDACDPADSDGDPCTYTPIDCDDGNPCSADSCDPDWGCMHSFPDPWVDYNCDTYPCPGGYCVYDYNAEVWECVTEPCDDGMVCTVDWCSEEGCEHEDNCDDGMACSEDWCEEEGCLHDYSDCGECTSGARRGCGTDVGDCSVGYQTCIDGWWGACVGGFGPSAEVCDGRDNDCDGSTDEGDVCGAVMLGRPGGPEVEQLPSTGVMPLVSGLSVSSMVFASLTLIGSGLLLRRRR